jgi:methylated-DNA-[protein]-cysteine S-methyltransferase
MNYKIVNSPVGELLIAADDDALRFVLFQAGKMAMPAPPEWLEAKGGIVHETIRQLDAYFAGKRREFDLPLGPRGTAFQERVWRELGNIPYGAKISYGELATRVGNPAASRAVGLANGRNPISIVIPCHRVIGANGKLTGYGGGLPVKEHLLAIEAVGHPPDM